MKDVLSKLPSFNDKTLRTVIFNVNQHVAPDGSGSPAQRFLKRRICNGLPTAIEKEVNYEDLISAFFSKDTKLCRYFEIGI